MIIIGKRIINKKIEGLIHLGYFLMAIVLVYFIVISRNDFIILPFILLKINTGVLIATAVLLIYVILSFTRMINVFRELQVFRKDDISQVTELLGKVGNLRVPKITTQPTYSISDLYFENYKGIKKIKIDLLPQASWIFLTGENGYGKTCILQAIAISLAGYEEHIFKHIRSLENVSLLTNVNGFKGTLGLKIKTVSSFSKKDPKFPYLACYGSSRLDSYTESSVKDEGVTKNIFDSRSLLENIEFQISRWFLKTEDKEFKNKFENVVTIVKTLLNLKSINIDKKTDSVLYIEQDSDNNSYEPVSLDQLAAGYRNLILMIGDMMLRLFKTQPEINDPSKLKGIVIIDELDLHLHPKWQKRLPTILSKIFPLIQFIVSTHSPLPLLGAPEGSVFLRVDRNAEEGIHIDRLKKLEKEIKYLLPNSILTSDIFDMDEIESVTLDNIDKIELENDYDDIQKNKEVKERLRTLNDILPDDLFKQ